MGDHEGTLKIENDDVTMKTKIFVNPFGSTFGILTFTKKTFFHTLIKFLPYWNHKPTNAAYVDSAGVNTSDKILNLSSIDKIRLKCDILDDSMVNGLRQPIIFSFD